MKKLLPLFISLIITLAVRAQPTHVLENTALKAVINLKDGSLMGFTSKATAWDILSNSSYGQSFEMNIKLKDGSFYMLNGKSQEPPKVTVNKDELLFIWNGIKAGASKVDVIFQGSIKITDKGLIYEGKLTNNSDAVIEQLSWPFIGNISIPEKTEKMLFHFMTYTTLNAHELYPNHSNTGWSNLPEHAFTLIHNNRQGVHLSSLDHKFEEYIRCVYEVLPTEAFAALSGSPDSKKDRYGSKC